MKSCSLSVSSGTTCKTTLCKDNFLKWLYLLQINRIFIFTSKEDTPSPDLTPSAPRSSRLLRSLFNPSRTTFWNFPTHMNLPVATRHLVEWQSITVKWNFTYIKVKQNFSQQLFRPKYFILTYEFCFRVHTCEINCFTYCIKGGMVSRDSIVDGDCCVIDIISM